MNKKMKVVCGVLSLGLAVYSFINGNNPVGVYWVAVTGYWLANYLS